MSNEELAVAIQQGDTDKTIILWEQVKGFVARQADRRIKLLDGYGGVEFDDLYNSGYIAFMRALHYFDAGKGFTFLNLLDKTLKTAFREASFGGYGKKVMKDPLHQAYSLDAPLEDGEDSTLEGVLPDESAERAFEETERAIWNEQLHDVLEQVLEDLPQEEREAIRARYYQGREFQEIGPDGQKLVHKGIRHLRYGRCRQRLESFVEERTPYFLHVGVARFQNTGLSSVEIIVLEREQLKKKYLNDSKK